MSAYAVVAQRIRREFVDLDRTVQRILRAWQQAKVAPNDQDLFLESSALNLHAFYGGLERIFIQIARRIDQDVPTDASWHITLLTQMETERPEVRPAVLSHDPIPALDELRRFRHLVRNTYTHNLVAGRMEGMIDPLPQTWSTVKAELLAFANMLDQLAEMAEQDS